MSVSSPATFSVSSPTSSSSSSSSRSLNPNRFSSLRWNLEVFDRQRRASPQGDLSFVAGRAVLPLFVATALFGWDGLGPQLARWLLELVGVGAVAVGGVEPWRLWAVVALSAVCSAKHVYWALCLKNYMIRVHTAILVCLVNAALEALSVLALFHTGGGDPLTLMVGVAMFVVGSVLETGAETMRDQWKKKQKNKGKVYTGGLFAYAQHINYFGFTVWRGGIALICGSYLYCAAVVVGFSVDFYFRAIPQLQAHNRVKYGEAFRRYAERTPIYVPFLL